MRRVNLLSAIAACALAFALTAAPAGASTWKGGGTGFALSPSGTVYSGNGNSVAFFSPTGEGIGTFGGGSGKLKMVMDLAVDANGDLLVSDWTEGIQRWSTGGTFIGTWGKFGCADGEFSNVRGLAVGAGGNVIVVGPCTFNNVPVNKPQLLDSTGNFIRRIGGDEMGRPDDVAVDEDGTLWITDGSNYNVHHYSADGSTLLGSFSVLPYDPGYPTTFDYPNGISVSGGKVFVTNIAARRAEEYSRDGTLIGQAALEAGTGSILALADGAVLVGGSAMGTVTRIDPVATAALTVTPSPATPLKTVTYDASKSAVPFGSIAKYEFDTDGDGTYDVSGTEPTTSRSFTQRSNFVAAVRVTAQNGTTATATQPMLIGPAGVSINGGAQWTNDPKVSVWVVWPLAAETLLISNDGGFTPASPFAVVARIPWTLDASGPERLPKTVYVRFNGGTAGNETYQDDVILDQTAPVISKATVAQASSAMSVFAAKRTPKYRITLRATDNVSGVATYQLTTNKRKPGKEIKYSRAIKYQGKFPVYVRVRDNAGNHSSFKKLKPSSSHR